MAIETQGWFQGSFVAYTVGEPFDQARPGTTGTTRHERQARADFSLKTDMLVRLLATQSGIMGQARLENWRRSFLSNCDSQRVGNYLWISLRRSHSSLARCQP